MNWRELTAQVDREFGVPEDEIEKSMKFADAMLPEAKAALEKEIPEDQIEATRQHMLRLRRMAAGMTLEQLTVTTNQWRATRN